MKQTKSGAKQTLPLEGLFSGVERSDPWYSGDYCNDPAFADAEPEKRANPSMESWGNPDYLEQQRRRLPSHKFRRLHLNLPGLPDGAALPADNIMEAIVDNRTRLRPVPERPYFAFVDMSGGSSDDATLGIAHRDKTTERTILDLMISQAGAPPFNPRRAVKRFAGIAKKYEISQVIGDRYAGETFRQDFSDLGVRYVVCEHPKSVLYEKLEPMLNAGEVELLDVPKLQEQLLGLVWRSSKIDHMPGEHDDFANAAAGALWLASQGDDMPWRGARPYSLSSPSYWKMDGW